MFKIEIKLNICTYKQVISDQPTNGQTWEASEKLHNKNGTLTTKVLCHLLPALSADTLESGGGLAGQARILQTSQDVLQHSLNRKLPLL